MTGKTLAQYEIGNSLGVGGMGEVYRARDTRLGRAVAVKFLPGAFAQDPERIVRFQREAVVLASLNHPNIAALYGLEEVEGRHFLVMELVEGDTLAERIARGPLALDETLKIAHQIVEALEAAHERGIVHRDLKPANVKITREGKVKVLDFGLAKAMETAPANANLSQSPTLSLAATNAGVILGTAAYMSPEQAKGAPADHRSDIFSLGCVLYEMLTGHQPFKGESIPEVLASVLARDPDLTALPARLHPRIPELLRRCLEKNPKRRWHAVADVRVEIEAVLEDPRGLRVEEQSRAVKGPLWRRALPVVAGVILSAVIASFATWLLKPAPPGQVTRFLFTLPEGQQFGGLTSRQILSVSPDGTQLVYAANNQLYLKPMRELRPIPIQGTEDTSGIANPVFSPDGRFVAYFSGTDGTLRKIPVNGGAPFTICRAGAPFGISWGPDGQIVFGQGTGGIRRVASGGGESESIISVSSGELAHGPQMLPGGDAILYTLATSDWNRAKIVVQSLSTGKPKTLIDGGSDARYLPTGHIVYIVNGILQAAPFDIKRLEVTSESIPVVEGVRFALGGTTGAGHFSISDTGLLAFVPGLAGVMGESRLAHVNRKGDVTPINLPPASYATPRVSPDGKQLAFVMDSGKESNVYVYDLSGGTSPRRLTFGGNNTDPVWAGNDRIAFTSDREGDRAIFSQPANNTGMAERLTKPETGTAHYAESWATSNEILSFLMVKNSQVDIWIRNLREKKETVLAGGPTSETNSAFRPDGRWIAYTSADSGSREVYMQPFPLTGRTEQVSRGGGAHPFWADTRELLYDRAGQLFSVSIQTEPSFGAGSPVALPITNLVLTGRPRNWDVLPGGKQLIGVFTADKAASGSAAAPQIHVVLNWFEELKQRMASR